MMASVQNEAMSPRKSERKPDLTTYRGRLGARIRARREELDMSIATLAEAMSVTVQSIYAWELGLQNIEIDRLAELAKALKTDVPSLMPKK